MNLSKDNSSVIGSKKKIDWDLLCVSGGYTPAIHLFTQYGGKLYYNESKSIYKKKKC